MKARVISLALFLGVISAGSVTTALAAVNAYQQTNFVSSVPNTATHFDPNFVNAWGIASLPGQPFFIANNGRGLVRTYNAIGDTVLPVGFGLAPAAGSTKNPSPSGIVGNPTDEFIVDGFASQFLIATEVGTISGWATENGNLPALAVKVIDNSAQSAVYKAIAVLTPDCCSAFLAVTNFHSGEIEAYTGFFSPLAPPGSFTDPALPAGYAPFGIQVIGTQVFVTYALQNAMKHNPVVGAGRGIVSVFDLEGNFVRRFATHGQLNAPWAVAKAGPNFGPFSNAILIGNSGDGTISGYDSNGKFLSRLKDKTGKVIVIPGLLGLRFGAGGTGDPNTLYFTAGPNQGRAGLFGALTVSK